MSNEGAGQYSGQPGSAKPTKTWLRITGSVLAGGLLVYWLIKNWNEVVQALQKVGWLGFCVVLGLVLVSRFCTVGRWHTLLHSAEVPISVRQSIELTFSGLFSANFLPTTVGGDLVRFAGGVRLGFDTVVIAASLVADRLIGMAGMATALPLGLYQVAHLPIAHTALSGLLAARVSDEKSPAPLRRVVAWGKGKIKGLWDSLLQALRLWLTRPKSLLLAYAFTWGHMLSVFFAVWVMLQRMGEPIPLWLVAGCWAMSYFPTLIPISINGLGVQELTLTFFFVTYGGVSMPAALAIASLMRLLPAIASLPGAFFVPGLLTADKQ